MERMSVKLKVGDLVLNNPDKDIQRPMNKPPGIMLIVDSKEGPEYTTFSFDLNRYVYRWFPSELVLYETEKV